MAHSRLLDPPAERVPYIIVSPPLESQRLAYHAYQILRVAFAVLFVVAGADKFVHGLTDWDRALAPAVERMLPIRGHSFMLIVGSIEVFAGVLVAVVPRVGAFFLAGWLGAIVINVLVLGDHLDVAVRNFGLALAAVALGLLARSQKDPLVPPSLAGYTGPRARRL